MVVELEALHTIEICLNAPEKVFAFSFASGWVGDHHFFLRPQAFYRSTFEVCFASCGGFRLVPLADGQSQFTPKR